MLKYRKPRTHQPVDMFRWWVKNLKREKPFLKVVGMAMIRDKMRLTAAKDVVVSTTNKNELLYTRKKILELDAEIIELEKSDLKKYYFTAATHKIFALKKEVKKLEDKVKELEKSDLSTSKILMTYKTFYKIIHKYNLKVAKALVEEGSSVKLWNYLGYIYILKSPKKELFSMKNIDWHSSKKLKQEIINKGLIPKDKENPEGKNWFQFYEDSDYLRVAWVKNYGIAKVPNNSVYAFYPTKSIRGIKKLLVAKNKEDVYLKEKYVCPKKKE